MLTIRRPVLSHKLVLKATRISRRNRIHKINNISTISTLVVKLPGSKPKKLHELHELQKGQAGHENRRIDSDKDINKIDEDTTIINNLNSTNAIYGLNEPGTNGIYGLTQPSTYDIRSSQIPLIQKNSEGFLDNKINPSLNKTPLNLFRSKRLSVSDLVTQYCELQRLYKISNVIHDRPSKASVKGTSIHKEMENQVNVNAVPIVIPEIPSKEDIWSIKYLNLLGNLINLKVSGARREIYVVGRLGGQYVSGIIDLLEMKEVKAEGKNENLHNLENNPQHFLPSSPLSPRKYGLHITDTKTRRGRRDLPVESQQLSAYHQLLIYYKLLHNLITGQTDIDEFNQSMDLDIHRPLNALSIANNSEVRQEISNLLTTAGLVDFLDPSGNITFTLAALSRLILQQFRDIDITVDKSLDVEYVAQTGIGATDHIATVTYQYDEQTFQDLMEFSMAFWKGERPAFGVDPTEKSKCSYCPAASSCEWFAQIY